MQIRCKSCDREIPASDVNIGRAIAKCTGCDAVFSFAGRFDERPAIERGEVVLPRSMDLDGGRDELRITRRWFGPHVIFLAFFCLFWDGFLVFWYAMALAGPGPEVDAGGPPLMVLIFPLLHVGVGVALTYYVVAAFLNRTVVRVDSDTLSITHGPVPWPGSKTLPAHSVKQLYCKSKVRSGKNGPQCSYRVELLRTDGGRDVLVKGLEDEEEALYIEQQLERHLRIEDEAVPGELARA